MKIVEIMEDFSKRRLALAAFNAPSFDAMVAIGRASSDTSLPCIVQTSARFVAAQGADALKAQFDLARKITGAELFLHLDHCSDGKLIANCVSAGWDMVMFDGSHLPIATNIQRAQEIVRLAHSLEVAVEVEVGPVGGEEDGIEHVANYASAQDIVAISSQTAADCLAVGFGNVHGDYSNKALLRWEILESAQGLAEMPLVLHGGSGLSDAEFQRAIKAGAAKINISTDLKKVYHSIMADHGLQQSVLKSPADLHAALQNRLSGVAKKYITLFSGERAR